MIRKFKFTLAVFLVVILGCFSQVAGATSTNTKKGIEYSNNIKLLDNADIDQSGVKGTSNLGGTAENSAKVGDSLTDPEIGWTRYDNTDTNIKCSGKWQVFNSDKFGFYKDSINSFSKGQKSVVRFAFTGSKLRIISWLDSSYDGFSQDMQIKIDGEKFDYSLRTKSLTKQAIVFESESLNNTNHYVEMTNVDNNEFQIDAIDVKDGNLLVYHSCASLTLSKTTDELTVGDTDNLIAAVKPANATNKDVTWTSSDNTIATVDANGNVTGVSAGTTTITATTTDGQTEICKVTVVDSNPADTSDKAILNITMTNGQAKKYNVTMDEVNKFMCWCELRSSGSGKPFYKFDITDSSNPSIKKTDYVFYDKISSFEVDDYTK